MNIFREFISKIDIGINKENKELDEMLALRSKLNEAKDEYERCVQNLSACSYEMVPYWEQRLEAAKYKLNETIKEIKIAQGIAPRT